MLSRRLLALGAALAFALSGSGLPMCASLLAQGAEPCGMHQPAEHHAAHDPQIVPDHHGDDPCHPDQGDLSCASGGTCPVGGTAAPLATAPALAASGLGRDVTPAIAPAYHSFLSPPPPPPPQG